MTLSWNISECDQYIYLKSAVSHAKLCMFKVWANVLNLYFIICAINAMNEYFDAQGHTLSFY